MYRLRNSFDQMKGQVSNCIYSIKVMISLSHQITTLDLSTASTYNRAQWFSMCQFGFENYDTQIRVQIQNFPEVIHLQAF